MYKTKAMSSLVNELLLKPKGKHWGYDLSRKTGISTAAMYPMLNRLVKEGYIVDSEPNSGEPSSGRPTRRYYTLTGRGRRDLLNYL